MTIYQLVQKSRSKTEEPSQYQLWGDNEILVESCSYTEGIEHLYQLIKPGDNYREKESGAKFISEITYEEVIHIRERDTHFNRGKL